MSRTAQIAILVALVLAAGLVVDSWLAGRKSSAQLAATLASQNALIGQAAAREQQRDAQLESVLAAIAAEKRRVQTPQQAATAIPSVLPPLPLPVKIQLPNLTESPKPGESAAAPALVAIPPADLKPLYDGLQDCRACALERDATKKDLADARAQVAALTRERDSAIALARGGTFWVRLKRSAKWFAIGVIAGATTAAASHH